MNIISEIQKNNKSFKKLTNNEDKILIDYHLKIASDALSYQTILLNYHLIKTIWVISGKVQPPLSYLNICL